MSDVAQPTAAEVRAAAEAIKTALDRHLAAVERRTGDDDPAVYAAFNELAAAAEEYDELLYDRYDEVTPFEIPASGEPGRYSGPEEPGVFSVMIRRDYVVADPQRFVAHAEMVAAADPDHGHAMNNPGTADALGVLFSEYEADEIASRHQEFGLAEGDSTLWIVTSEEPAEPGEWLGAPFDHPDFDHVLHRFEASSVFTGRLSQSFDYDVEEEEGDEDLEVLDSGRA